MMGHPAFQLDWNLVRTFCAVARAGSLAAGARDLDITHPTAARHIQSLEENIGVSLFTRTGKGLVLNEAGEKLRLTAHDMHDRALAFQSITDGMQARDVGRVRVTVADTLAELLPEIMMTNWHPQKSSRRVAIDMVVTNELLNLLQRDADIALRHARPEQQELVCKRLGILRLGVFAHRSYFEEYGELNMENHGKHRFIDSLSSDYLVQGAAKQGLNIRPEQVVFRSDSNSCRRSAVDCGLGVGAFPVWMGRQEPQWVMLSEHQVELEVWLVARPEVRQADQLNDVFSCISQVVSEHLEKRQTAPA